MCKNSAITQKRSPLPPKLQYKPCFLLSHSSNYSCMHMFTCSAACSGHTLARYCIISRCWPILKWWPLPWLYNHSAFKLQTQNMYIYCNHSTCIMKHSYFLFLLTLFIKYIKSLSYSVIKHKQKICCSDVKSQETPHGDIH